MPGLDSPLISRRQYLGFKAEATTGTAQTLTGTDCAIRAFDVVVAPDQEPTKMQRPGGYGTLPPVRGAAGAKATFKTYFHGNGDATTPLHMVLLEACGFTASAGGVLTADPHANTTLTIGKYLDGGLALCYGAMGDATITIAAGKPVLFDWNFLGKWSAPTAVALPTVTLPSIQPPICAGAVITVGGTAYRFPEMKISLGNKVTRIEDGADDTAWRAGWILDREAKVTISPNALGASHAADWYTKFAGATNCALSALIGTAASGNSILIAAANMSLSRPAEDDDNNGRVVDKLEFQVDLDSLVITMAPSAG